jgi:uridylate kinase
VKSGKTPGNLRYQKIILKLSGEMLAGGEVAGFSPPVLDFLVGEIAKLVANEVKVGIVLGAGNILRARQMTPLGMERVVADQAGMLATVINSMVFAEMLKRRGIAHSLYSAFALGSLVEGYNARKAREDLEDGRVVILAGGTGNPYFTTDTAAVLRARELGAELLLKGTKVDGIFSEDPKQNPAAQFFPQVSYDEFLNRSLSVMDLTAVSLAKEGNLPIMVFNLSVKDAMLKIARGEKVGSRIGEA